MMRRIFALFIIAAAATLSAAAQAQWPERPVKVIVPVGAGSANDVAARVIAERLGAMWNARVLVENFPGAGGIRGAKEVIGAAPDGYTLGFLPGSTVMVSPVIYPKADLNPDRDLAPVAPVMDSPMAIAANPSLGINNLADLIRAAKAQPGKLSIATLPQNTAVHLAAELFKTAAGIDLYVVPHNQPSDAVLSTVRGDTQLSIGVIVTMSELARAGKLKLLATTAKQRLAGYEDMPAAGETVNGFSLSSWGALFAPAGTPAAVIERISRDVRTALAHPDVLKRFAAGGIWPMPGSTADLAAAIKNDRPMWEKVARTAGKAE